MTVVAIIGVSMLGVTGLLCLVRIVRGPTMLDRTVAADVFVAACVGAVGLEAAVGRHDTTLPLMLALALIGFLGSVSVARFAGPDRPGAADTTDIPGSGRGPRR
jgi:multicomponent Na+:H+ antiporter subunit F